MKHHLVASIASAGLALFSLTAGQAAAQYHEGAGSGQAQEGSYRGRDWQRPVLVQVRKDLDHARSKAVGGPDISRIDHTMLELTELQGNLSEYWRDEHELDEVLGSLQKVVTENRLSPQDRDVLEHDLARMRDYREHQEAWR